VARLGEAKGVRAPLLVEPIASGGVDAPAPFGVGNVVLGIGGRRTGETGAADFEAKIFSATDELSEGIPDCGDAVEESVSLEDEGDSVGSVLSPRSRDVDIGLVPVLPGKGLTSEDQTLGEERGSEKLLRF
jgi:hypothetical protein